MINGFSIKKGSMETAISIMKEVAAWGRSVGLPIWKDEQLTPKQLLIDCKEDNFYIGQVSKDNACCMILQWKDTQFWPKAAANEAGYIHKLCVRRKYASIGLSKEMIEFAIKECKQRNINYLRLDTGWHKKKLCNLYKSLGFSLVGQTQVKDRGEFALFEMKI